MPQRPPEPMVPLGLATAHPSSSCIQKYLHCTCTPHVLCTYGIRTPPPLVSASSLIPSQARYVEGA